MAKHNPTANDAELNQIANDLNTIEVKDRDGNTVTLATSNDRSKQWQDEHPRRESLQKGDRVVIEAGTVARAASFTDQETNAVTNYIGIPCTIIRGDQRLPFMISWSSLIKANIALGSDGVINRDERRPRFGKAYPWHFHAHEQTVGEGENAQTRVTQLQVLDERVDVVLSEAGPVRTCGTYDSTTRTYAIGRKVDSMAYAPVV